MKLLVLKIHEPDYGCEERMDDYVKLDKLVLGGDDFEEIEMEVRLKHNSREEIAMSKGLLEDIYKYMCIFRFK